MYYDIIRKVLVTYIDTVRKNKKLKIIRKSTNLANVTKYIARWSMLVNTFFQKLYSHGRYNYIDMY